MRLRVSSGSAAALGLLDIRRGAEVRTAYVMIGEGECAFACSFCPQGTSSRASHDLLSRVTWPEYPEGVLLDALEGAEGNAAPRRLCLQVLGGPAGLESAGTFLGRYRARGGRLPVSVNAALFDPESAEALFDAGCDRLGLAMDAATPALFRRHKLDRPGAFAGRRELLETLARAHPGRISTHFIAGLGETEEEMVDAVHRALAAGITVGLFAFTPVRGTPLEDHPPPGLSGYRRLQLARYLMSGGRAVPGDFSFRGGRIVAVEIRFSRDDIARAIRTSGCPDCNRPYYNERPGETPYNYPHPPGDGAIDAALRALELPGAVDLVAGEVSSRG